jgi:hypothetical protein
MVSASEPNWVTNIERILRFCKKWGKIFKSDPSDRLFTGIYLAETQLVQG